MIKTITLYADDTSPSLAITNPVSGQVSSNGVFTVRGTATDNLGLSNVWVQINGGAWIKATGTTNWSADVTPANGTNIVQAYAEDLAGNVSTTNSVDFRYGAPLTVILHGGGTVTPSCCRTLSQSQLEKPSTILPSRTRRNAVTVHVACLPVGGMPFRCKDSRLSLLGKSIGKEGVAYLFFTGNKKPAEAGSFVNSKITVLCEIDTNNDMNATHAFQLNFDLFRRVVLPQN